MLLVASVNLPATPALASAVQAETTLAVKSAIWSSNWAWVEELPAAHPADVLLLTFLLKDCLK